MSLQLIRPDINLDFVGKRYFFVALSTAINIARDRPAVHRGPQLRGRFRRRQRRSDRVHHPTNGAQIRKALEPLDLGEVTVQDFGARRSSQFLARFEKVKNIGSIGPRTRGARSTKPTGRASRRWCGSRRSAPRSAAICAATAFMAVIFATVFMGVYIALQFRGVSWSFGAGAVIALIHDVLVVIGALVISRTWSSI